ncbi:MAG: hypothetical protein ACPGQL_07945 [Thermoplasmatota archaeon]
MLRFDVPQENATPAERQRELLLLARATLAEQGMADMEEYGDMLKWGLPKEAGRCRNLHVFHPDWCSFGDQYRGTIHYHPGEIRGTILLGGLWHDTYEATPDPDGDRHLAGQTYSLTRHTRHQPVGTSYSLSSHVPHWIRPTALTLTYFEEEDNGEMGDLLEPATDETDEHTWSQADAEALMPVLLAAIDARLASLEPAVNAQLPPAA